MYKQRYDMKEEADGRMDRINEYIPEGDRKKVYGLIKELIGKAQDEGFMKGYEYAIRLLQESLVKCDKE